MACSTRERHYVMKKSLLFARKSGDALARQFGLWQKKDAIRQNLLQTLCELRR